MDAASAPRGERILLTGASGYIGGRLLEALARDNDVVAAGRRPPASAAPHRFVAWDLTAPAPAGLPERVDRVLHLAQDTGRDPARREETLAVNTVATARLAAYAAKAGARSYLYTSTGSVYGMAPAPLDEDAPARARDPYAVSKLAGEVLARGFAGDVPVIVLRYFVPYGPGQVQRMVPALLQRVADGQPVVVNNGVGMPRTNPIYIDDAVEATARAATLPASVTLNVGGAETVSVAELAGRLATLLGRPLATEAREDRAVADLVGDTRRMEKALGFRPRVRLDDGLRRTVEAWRATR